MLDRILCLHEKYYNWDPSNNLSSANFLFHRSIEIAGIAKDVKVFYYDIGKKTGIHYMLRNFLAEIENYRPDAVVWCVPLELIPEMCFTLQYVREKYHIRIIAFFGDLISGLALPERHHFNKMYAAIADTLVSMDSTCTQAIYHHPCNIQGFPTVDLKTFHPMRGIVKDIDVSFLGSLSSIYGSRGEYLKYIKPRLEEKGYVLYVGGGAMTQLGDRFVTMKDYVRIINRSKIVLNFSQTFCNYRQMKGRIMEGMASKACVVTEHCPDTEKFFKEDVDYVSFNSKEELLEKLLYYLESKKARESIAKSAYSKMITIYKPRNVWGYIFKKTGFEMTDIDEESFKQYETKMNDIQRVVDITYPSLHTSDYIIEAINNKKYALATDLAVVRLQLFPLDPEEWFLLGKTLYYRKQYQAARQAFERCIFLDPLTKRTHYQLTDLFAISQNDGYIVDISNLLKPPQVVPVTAIIITRNNESTIRKCIKSIVDAVDKIVIVDMGSHDDTKKIIKEMQIHTHVFLFEKEPVTYEEALLLGTNHSAGGEDSWIFHINPDEYLLHEDIGNVKLAASLFHGQDVVLNILSTPIFNEMKNQGKENICVEINRLVPLKHGIISCCYGFRYVENSGLVSKTINIRIQQDVLSIGGGEE